MPVTEEGYTDTLAMCRVLWAIIKFCRAIAFDLIYIKLVDHAEYARLKALVANAGNELNCICRRHPGMRKEVYDGTV